MFEKIKRNLRGLAGYLVLGICVYAVMLYFTFPYESVINGIIENAQKQYNVKLKIAKISPALPLGFKAKGIEISKRGLTGPSPLKISSLKISVPIIGTLLYPFTKRLNFKAAADLERGRISASVSSAESSGQISMAIDSLNLKSLSAVVQESGLDITGMVSSADIVLASQGKGLDNFDIMTGTGKLTVNLKDFSIAQAEEASAYGRGRISYNMSSAISLMPFPLKILSGQIIVNRGLIEIKDLSLERDDLSGKIAGVIKLERRTDDSLIDLGISLKLSEQEQKIRTLLMFSGEKIGCPLRPDGTVSCKINGTLRDLSGPAF